MDQLFLTAFTVSPIARAGIFSALVDEGIVPNPVHAELLADSLMTGGFSNESKVLGYFSRLQIAAQAPDVDTKKVGDALKALQKGVSKLPESARNVLRNRAFAMEIYDTEMGLNTYRAKQSLPTGPVPEGLTQFHFAPAEFSAIRTGDEWCDFQRNFGVTLMGWSELLAQMGVRLFRGPLKEEHGLSCFLDVDTEVLWPAVPSELGGHISAVVRAGAESSGVLFDNVDVINGIDSKTGLWGRMQLGAKFLYANGWTEKGNAFLQVARFSKLYHPAPESELLPHPRLVMALLQADYDASGRVATLSINIVERGLRLLNGQEGEVLYRANPLLRATFNLYPQGHV